jgi:hypothetical protein
MSGRRGFLKLLAALPAVPAADKLAGVDVAAGGTSWPGIGPAPMADGSYLSNQMKMAALIKSGMMPDWFVKLGRKNCQMQARILDPDIACLRSVSLSAKVAMQSERNWTRSLNSFEEDMIANSMQSQFYGWSQP